MRSFQVSIATASCTLMLSAGVAFANDLHKIVTPPGQMPIVAPHSPGQTGSNVLASCGTTAPFYSIGSLPNGSDPLSTPAKSNTGTDSPFNPSAAKGYAGNPGNPATNPIAHSQYDNACAQAAQHMP